MQDHEYYESYGYSHEEAVAQARTDRASNHLIYAFFRLLFKCFLLFFLLLPSIFCGFLILQKLKISFATTGRWEYVGWLCGAVYIIECLVFFLKGWLLSLRDRDNRLWLLLMAICLLYCFIFPAYIFQTLITAQFKRTPGLEISKLEIISWIGGIILGWIIYRRYRLTEESAPFLFRWTFHIGHSL